MQKCLTTYVKKHTLSRARHLVEQFLIEDSQKWLLSDQISRGSESESGAWMYASTHQPFSILPDDVFCDEVTFRLGLPPPIRAYCDATNGSR